MERNVERKTLSFSKGMTNVPSDLLSDDSELLESDGFIYKDGEMKPIQKPVVIDGLFDLLYIHKGADYRNYVQLREANTGDSLIFSGSKEDGKIDDSLWQVFDITYKVLDVKSVGNTVIIATDKGIAYFLYKGGKYKELGADLPTPTFTPYMQGSYVGLGGVTACNLEEIIDTTVKRAVYDADGNYSKIIDDYYDDGGSHQLADNETWYAKYDVKNDAEKASTFQTAVKGHAAAVIAKVKEKGYFLFPFFVRCALKLYDGSYTKISAPILCYPTINRNCKFVPVSYDDSSKNYIETNPYGGTNRFLMYPYYAKLHFAATIEGIENWKDIVKELVVFASDDVTPFYMDEDWKFASPDETTGEYYINFQNSRNAYKQQSSSVLDVPDLLELTKPVYKFTKDDYPAREVLLPKYKTDAVIINELVNKSQFYKLFSIDNESSYLGGASYEAPIQLHTIENLTMQEQLKTDDYYGWTKIVAKSIYTYNKRANLFNIKRYPFKGFNLFHDVISSFLSNFKFTYYVHIVSDSMDCWVKSDEIGEFIPDTANAWLYYPDPNATEMIIWDSVSSKGMKIKLSPHPMLNGAYSFKKLPTENTFSPSDDITIPTIDNTAYETMNSQIFTSVVNNPFLFEASGDNTVGTGSILGIAANTEAVSQGQFGQYPLFVFTTEGIYAMSVTSEGLYGSIYPVSREVCNNANSITPTDRLVYFTSKKGLMAVSGGTAQAVSVALNGRNPRNFAEKQHEGFLDFLESCVIAYDYRDSMLRIFKKSNGFNEDGESDEKEKDYYVYNITDDTFGMATIDVPIKSVTNDYPDNVIQDISEDIYSLTGKPDINEDEEKYSGSITTRPLKLGGSMTLKSLRAIKNLVDTDGGKISLEIWGSNDCKHWCKLHSTKGKPWKYFTFKYTLENFKATDSFAGSIVEVQSRREDKMR